MIAGAGEWAKVVVIIVLVALISVVIDRWVKSVERNTLKARHALDTFGGAAETLIDDVRTPLPLAEFLVDLSTYVAGRAIFARWSTGRRKPPRSFDADGELETLANALPPDLHAAFFRALVAALASSAMADLFAPERLCARLFQRFGLDADLASSVCDETCSLVEGESVGAEAQQAARQFIRSHPSRRRWWNWRDHEPAGALG